MGNGDRWWYLADRNSLDTKRGDYYRVKSTSDTPPQTGWVVDDQTEGLIPCPTITFSALGGITESQPLEVRWFILLDSKSKSNGMEVGGCNN